MNDDYTWRKSSRSAACGECVEVGWRRSSRCDSGTCVEVSGAAATVAMRDSKDPDGPVLKFAEVVWRGFVADVRAGRYDL